MVVVWGACFDANAPRPWCRRIWALISFPLARFRKYLAFLSRYVTYRRTTAFPYFTTHAAELLSGKQRRTTRFHTPPLEAAAVDARLQNKYNRQNIGVRKTSLFFANCLSILRALNSSPCRPLRSGHRSYASDEGPFIGSVLRDFSSCTSNDFAAFLLCASIGSPHFHFSSFLVSAAGAKIYSRKPSSVSG